MNELIIIGIIAAVFAAVIIIAAIVENFAAIVRFCRCVVEVIAVRIFKAQTAYYKRRQRKRSREAERRHAALLRLEREAQYENL